jgi:hypothetical protein
MKQSGEQSLHEYASQLRVAAYKLMKKIPENVKEEYLLTAFLKGINNRVVSTAIEALKPKTIEDAVKLAEEEEKYTGVSSPCHLRGIQNEEVSVNRNDLRIVLNQLSFLQKQVNYLISLHQNNNNGDRRKNESPVIGKQNIFPNTPIRQYRQPEQRNNSQSIVCYRCNQKGHFARNCQKVLRCSACAGNHLIKDCHQQRRHLRRIQTPIPDIEQQQPNFDDNNSNASQKDHSDDNISQTTEQDCFVVRQDTRRKRRPLSEKQTQVEAWTAYIENRGRRPKRVPAPTVISTSRSEKAKNKPLIRGFCEGLETKLFLDSGAEVNVIDHHYFQTLQSYTENRIPFKPQEGSILCANGSRMRTHGMASLKVAVGHTVVNLNFTVASNLFPKIIIGIRGMKTLNVQLNPAQNCAIAGDVHIPFISTVTQQSIWSGNDKRSIPGASDRPQAQPWLH